MFVQLSENDTSESLLDLDALSGFTELNLQTQEDGVVFCLKLGVSLGSLLRNVVLPSQLVTIVPRYVVINESKENITVRQCYLQVCNSFFNFKQPFLQHSGHCCFYVFKLFLLLCCSF